MAHEDSNAVNELRHALWGAVDEGSRSVGRAIEAESDGPVGVRVASHRRLREVLSNVATVETPPELRSWLRTAVAKRRPAPAAATPPMMDMSWLRAMPMTVPAGFRGSGRQLLVACAYSGGELQAQVDIDADGAGWAVTGRLLGADREPRGDSTIGLFVDNNQIGSTKTDPRGEFAFDEKGGKLIGVRIGDDPHSIYVLLVDLYEGNGERGTAR